MSDQELYDKGYDRVYDTLELEQSLDLKQVIRNRQLAPLLANLLLPLPTFGIMLTIAALAMCMLFVLVDMGRPDRLLHILPLVGTQNLPSSLLAWDVVVLNVYLLLNLQQGELVF